jgi:hypothetical protein
MTSSNNDYNFKVFCGAGDEIVMVSTVDNIKMKFIFQIKTLITKI